VKVSTLDITRTDKNPVELTDRKGIYETPLRRNIQLIEGWIRAIRLKFLLASLIASAIGISFAFWKYSSFDLNYALLTMAGVFSLHASIDLLNDYWDYKRGIDKVVKRTKFSGGSGVIPENILSPQSVYKAAMLLLIIGISIGGYFTLLRGPLVAVILVFAVLAIFFYSSKIVNFGLAELFVGIKGALIVIGSFYVQTSFIEFPVIFLGIIVGLLSSSVLLINSFPDYKADRLGGRRTAVIILGKKRSYKIFSMIVMAVYALILIGIFVNYLSVYSIACLASTPYSLRAIRELRENYEGSDALLPAMASTIKYSRITSLALLISMLVPISWELYF
jgi:1,4-dihydroxy-2-naphthoate octaprenyltransferase